jgi:hypothetical protein
MTQENPGAPAPTPGGTAGGAVPPQPAATGAKAPAISPLRLWACALGAGVAVALTSWLVGEAVVDRYQPKTHVVFGAGGPMSIASPAELWSAQFRNATLANGLLGAVLGAVLGIAGGLASRSTRAGVAAAHVGLVLGMAAGAGASQALLPLYHRFEEAYEEKASGNLTVPLLIHGGVWSAVGACGGLAFGVGARGRGRAARGLVGGLVGAAVGTAVYELAGALAFPLAGTVQPLSHTWESRLLARSAVALLAAAGTALALADARAARGKPAPAPPDL